MSSSHDEAITAATAAAGVNKGRHVGRPVAALGRRFSQKKFNSAVNYDSGKVRGRRAISFIFIIFFTTHIRTPAIPLELPDSD